MRLKIREFGELVVKSNHLTPFDYRALQIKQITWVVLMSKFQNLRNRQNLSYVVGNSNNFKHFPKGFLFCEQNGDNLNYTLCSQIPKLLAAWQSQNNGI